MTTDSDYLIVYGTLGPSFENSSARYLRQHSSVVGDGTFPGLLIDLGEYPGAVHQPGSDQLILGTIYNIEQHKQTLLAYLDDYEGIVEQSEQPAEYIRTVVPVSWNGGIIYTWAYLYNLPSADKPIISSGDYSQYRPR